MQQTNRALIGWAMRDITPDRPVNLCGQFHLRISQGVQDPVTATALSISAGAEALVWVSCDLLFAPTEVVTRCRERLQQRIPGFPADKLILSATHTHTAPEPAGFWHPPTPPGVMSSAEYAAWFCDRIVEAVVESWESRQPGALSWGYGHAVVGHNRRAVYFDDLTRRPGFVDSPGMRTTKTVQMYGNTNDPQFSGLEGYVDHSVNLLFTFDPSQRLTGAVFNLPCSSQATESLEVISADFWHDTRLELRKRHGANLFLLPQCAPAGDLSPHLLYNKAAEQRMLQMKGRSSRQDIALRLATAFDEILAWAKNDMREQVELKHIVRTVALARRRISAEEYRYVQKGLADLEKTPAASGPDADAALKQNSALFARKYRCRRVLQRYEEQDRNPTLPIELHVVRLGDVAFATNPFELYLDYGLRMTARSPAVQTFLVQLAAGSWAGYLPTRKAVEGESYSACLYCNEVGPEGGQQLVEETLNAMQLLWT